MKKTKVKALLEAIVAREDLRARRSADPVDFVHRYTQPEDRELGTESGAERSGLALQFACTHEQCP
jgi:hypothetical protein